VENKDLNSKNRATTAPRVLLTDTNRWPLGARLAMGLADVGCEVSAVCPTHGHPLQKTSIVRRTFAYSGLRPLRSLQAAIERTKPHMIIPCDDRSAQHLHELHGRARSLGAGGSDLAALLERSLGRPEGYPVVSARYDLLEIASELGIRVPEMKLIDSVDDLKAWHETAIFPWVLKADGTFGGGGVRIAHSMKQAAQAFQELTEMFGAGRVIKRLCVNRDPFWLRPWWNLHRPTVIAQGYIQGRPANCAVVCWEGKVLAGIGVEVVSADGLTGPASIVRVVNNPEMMLAGERIANRLGVSGFFGLDFMIEDKSGAAYLIEMNPRCTPLCHLQLGKGRDMAGALWAQLTGQPLQERPPVTENDMIAYYPQAWNSKSELLQSSFQDLPQQEPALILELLRPWPDRSLLFRLSNRLQHIANLAAGLLTNKLSNEGGVQT